MQRRTVEKYFWEDLGTVVELSVPLQGTRASGVGSQPGNPFTLSFPPFPNKKEGARTMEQREKLREKRKSTDGDICTFGREVTSVGNLFKALALCGFGVQGSLRSPTMACG